MVLSEKAVAELKKNLEKEIGVESVSMLNEKDINHIGVFLLSTFAESLKITEKRYNKS